MKLCLLGKPLLCWDPALVPAIERRPQRVQGSKPGPTASQLGPILRLCDSRPVTGLSVPPSHLAETRFLPEAPRALKLTSWGPAKQVGLGTVPRAAQHSTRCRNLDGTGHHLSAVQCSSYWSPWDGLNYIQCKLEVPVTVATIQVLAGCAWLGAAPWAVHSFHYRKCSLGQHSR